MYNISQAFRQELRKPNHQVASKATLLDTNFREIPNGDFFTKGADEFQDYIVDGNVDVDRDRGTRRTGSITLLNDSGNFTPDGDITDYDGKFYVNRSVRLFRGVTLGGGTTLYAPIGTFMIDVIDVFVERNMSSMNLTLSDHWKKLTKSLVTRSQTWKVGTHVNTIIKSAAQVAGADYPLAPVLDPLTSAGRTTANTTLNTALTWERGDNRGDLLKTLGNRFGIDIYFNVEGRLTTQDRSSVQDQQEVWHFYSSNNILETGMLNTVRRTLSDDNLANHVFVIGSGDPRITYIYEKKDMDLASPTNITRIGDRVIILENQGWKSQAVVDSAGAKLWAKRFNLFEEVELGVICNPALEADDMIRITETKFSKISGLYRIVQMNVPLTTSLQTIRVTRNVYA